MLNIKNLTVEGLETGCVTDTPAPRFGFALAGDGENRTLQTATVTVGDWQATTGEQINIPYAGAPLHPFTRYTVRVTATADNGEQAEAETDFTTGRLGTPWAGEWITDTAYTFTEKKSSPLPMQFRKAFTLAKAPVRATVYATALGIYELTLNGQKVGRDYFAPGLTSYKHTLQYQSYEVGALLHPETGENVLTAVVGGGWAVGAFTMDHKNRITAPRQAFLCELRLEYADGTTETLGSDATWQVSEDGPYRYGDFYNGEIYDATVDESRIDWRAAGPETVKIHPEILAGYGSPVQAHEALRPLSVTRAKSGMMIYDFGQNFAGVIRAKIKNARRGQKITFLHSEILMEGELFRVPLRSAKAAATYTCTDGAQEYSPRLTYMGFRYVGVSGIAPEDLELTACALYSAMAQTGSFSCSHPLINKLQQNICWSTKSNFMDIPTDCPQRDERMGWTGDIALFAPTAAYNFDARRFLEKWLADVKAEQRPGGGINVVIPAQGFDYPPAVVAYWGDCCILVPWAMYNAYGDTDILRTMYPVMKKYLSAVQFWAGFASAGRTHRHTWRWFHQYGDWVAPNVSMWSCMNRGVWTATACWANSCHIMAQIATLLGEQADAVHYTDLKKEIDRAYAKRFLDENGKMKKLPGLFSRNAQRFGTEFQSGYVLPIAFDMLDAPAKKQACEHLLRLVREGDYHIRTGFPGTPFILFALADNGYAEDAYKMLLTDTCPSWLYEAKVGTTIWERWDALREDGSCNTGKDDGTNGMTSFNHYASGAVGNFLYRRIAGIEPAAGGYRRFAVKPVLGGGLSRATGTVQSPYGAITSDWALADGVFTISVTVPISTRCTLTLPNGAEEELGSGQWTRTCTL